MKVITGKVVQGRIEFPPGELAEGASVAIVSTDDEAPFSLTPEDERELLDRLDAVARGEYVDGDEFLRGLKSRRQA